MAKGGGRGRVSFALAESSKFRYYQQLAASVRIQKSQLVAGIEC